MSDTREIAIDRSGASLWRKNITLLAAISCLLIACLSCPSERARLLPPADGGSELVVFLTGNELSSLRPCGCSGGQLGGLEKRPAVFDRVPASHRLLVGAGALVANDGEQDLIKFRILFEALRLLDYDVLCMTSQDLAVAESLGLLMNSQQEFVILKDQDPGSEVFTKQLPEAGATVRVAAFDPRTSPVDRVTELFGREDATPTLDILILRHCDDGLLEDITAKSQGIDCIVCPSDADEPHLLSEPGARPLVVTLGRFGRYICRLRAAKGGREGEPVLQFESIPVAADLPDDPALVQLYRQYQQLVNEANLLESYPRIPLPDGLAFTGSEDCRRCHEYEYDMWSTKAHADAMASLKKVGSDRDPECVVCHVVGMEYEGGYVTEEKTPHLSDVGCETCHGPGSEHAQTYGLKLTRQPQMTCLTCHTPEKSTGYAGHEEEYMQKIVHWREPAAAGNVKH